MSERIITPSITACPPMSMSTFGRQTAAGMDEVRPFVTRVERADDQLRGARATTDGADIIFAAFGLGCCSFFAYAAEAVDAAGRVDQLLLAGEERVALRADLDAQLFPGRAGGPGLAAGAVDRNLLILRMDLWFHELTSNEDWNSCVGKRRV